MTTTTTATTTSATTRVQYHTTVREMPSDERPRERLERYGAGTLQTAELLAIILRVGVPGENVIELSSRLLRQYGGIGGLLTADLGVLCAEHGLGPAKATTLKAALELGRRLTLLSPEQRPQITSPGDVASLLGLAIKHHFGCLRPGRPHQPGQRLSESISAHLLRPLRAAPPTQDVSL
jgi:hypothetical protein